MTPQPGPYGGEGRAFYAGGLGGGPLRNVSDAEFILASTHSGLTNAHAVADSPTVSWEYGGSTVQAHVIGGGTGGGSGGVAISADGQLATGGTVIFSNSNNFSFGMAGSVITGSYTVPDVSPFLTTAALSNHSHGNPQLNLTNLSGTTASNSAGFTLSLSASTYLTTAALSNHSHGNPSLNLTNLSGTTNSNSAGFSLSLSGPAAVTTNGLISRVNLSAGTTSQNLSAATFADSNGVSFGLSGSVITATVQTNYLTTAALSNHSHGNPTLNLTNLSGTTASNSAGLTFSLSAASTFAQLSAGFSTGGNTLGDTGLVTARMVLAGGPNITLSGSTNGGSITVSISGGAGAAGNTGFLSAGTATASLGTVSFSDASGVSFGISGQTITATVKTDYQTSGAYLTTAMQSNAATISNVRISAGTTNTLLSNFSLANSNGVSFGLNGSTITATVQTNYLTTAMQSNAATISNINFSAGTTSQNLSKLTFADSNGVSFGLSGSQVTATVKTDYQTSGAYLTTAMQSNAATISNINFSAGTTSQNLSKLTFADSNGVSFGLSGSQVTATVKTDYQTSGAYLTTAMQSNAATISNVRVSAGTTSNLLSALTFADSNGVSFGINASTITATVKTDYLTTAALSNHSHGNPQLNLTNLSGTTASASNGFTLSLSAAAPGGGGSVLISAGTTNNSFSNFSLADSNGVSFGINGSTITATVQTNYLTTAMQSNAATISNIKLSAGTSSANLSAATFADSNGVSFGLNGSTMTGSIAQYSLVFQGSNGVSFGTSTNGSTTSVTANAGYLSFYENLAHMGHEQTMTLNGASISHVVAFALPLAGSFSFLRIPMVVTAGSTSRTVTASSMSASVERYSTFNAVVYSLGTGASSKSLISVTSSSVGWTFRNSVSIAANGTQGSYTQGLSCAAEGNGTTLTTQYSVSNANSYQFSSTAFSDFTGSRFLDIHWANSLSAGPYWLVFGYSSSSATNSTGMSAASVCGVGYSNHYGVSQANIAFGIMGSTNLSSGAMLGAGSFSTAGGGTTSGFPISAITSSASHVRPYFQLIRSA